MTVVTEQSRVASALKLTGFETVTTGLLQATYIALPVGDAHGHEVLLPFESYPALKPRIMTLWRELLLLVRSRERPDRYWTREQQYARLQRLWKHRFAEDEPLIWGLLLIHAEKMVREERFGPETPRVNRLAYALGFRPDYGLSPLNEWLGLDHMVSNRYGAAPVTVATHLRTDDTVSAFIHFYLAKLQRLKRVSVQHRMALVGMEQGALNALDFLATTSEVFRGWVMVGFSFLAPYALAPELVAAGGVATATGIRAATQAETIAAELAHAGTGAHAMLKIIDVAPGFLELAFTLGRIFHGRPSDKPLTPGEVFELIMSGLGAIPSARLGHLMTGVSVASMFDATQDFLDWLLQAALAIEQRAAAAEAGLEVDTFDSAHTLVVEIGL